VAKRAALKHLLCVAGNSVSVRARRFRVVRQRFSDAGNAIGCAGRIFASIAAAISASQPRLFRSQLRLHRSQVRLVRRKNFRVVRRCDQCVATVFASIAARFGPRGAFLSRSQSLFSRGQRDWVRDPIAPILGCPLWSADDRTQAWRGANSSALSSPRINHIDHIDHKELSPLPVTTPRFFVFFVFFVAKQLDERTPHANRPHVHTYFLRRRANSMPSTRAWRLASMIFSLTPTVPHSSRPLEDWISTRVLAAVPVLDSRIRTL